MVKNLPVNAGDSGWEDLLGKQTATYSTILAWEIPWTEKPGADSPWGCKRVGHNLATKQVM